MSEAGEGQQPQQEPRLTEQEQRAKDLIFQSFRFSQGNTTLQDHILKWLVAKDYFDSVDIPNTLPTYIREIVVPKKHKTLTDQGRRIEVARKWFDVYDFKKVKQSLSSEELAGQILKGMLERDLNYQKRERPNRSPSSQERPDSSNDPHMSFTRKYIINSQPTGNDAFDEMCRGVAPIAELYRTHRFFIAKDSRSTRKALFSLKNAWEHNHPGYTFFPPEQSPGESAY